MAQPPDGGERAPAPPPLHIDLDIWSACATSPRLPAVGSQVYYFPDGHAEQCGTPVQDLAPLASQYVLCTVGAVHLSADAESDEPFATISLLPDFHGRLPAPAPAPSPALGHPLRQFLHFSKQLSNSDTRLAMDTNFYVGVKAGQVFPELDKKPNGGGSPSQKLHMTDLHGRPWEFEHVCYPVGNFRRHFFKITNWVQFIESKGLVEKDTVVFMRCTNGQLLVAVRRERRDGGHRDVRKRVPRGEAVDASKLLQSSSSFNVTYYPEQSAGEFLVSRPVVDKALSNLLTRITPGMEVEPLEAMVIKGGRITSGIVKSVSTRVWRMLEVEWLLQKRSGTVTLTRRVSPWEVRILPPKTAMLPHSQPPADMQGPSHTVHTDVPSSSSTAMLALLLSPGALPCPDQPGPSGQSSELLDETIRTAMTLGDRITLADSGGASEQVSQVPAGVVDETVGSQIGSPHSITVMRTIKLFGTTITAPVESDTSDASEQVDQAPHGVDEETDNK